MQDTIYIKQGERFIIIAEKSIVEPKCFSFIEFLTDYHHYIILGLWVFLSIGVVYGAKKIFQSKLFLQGRILLYYFIISIFIMLLVIGKKFNFLENYLDGIITELIGICITVFIIDKIVNYISKKQEEVYRGLALKSCKMPIYIYCSIWISIYKSNARNRALTEFESLESFFQSDDFHNAITSYDFNQLIADNKSYGKYYNSTVLKVSEKFQNILAKYASKLSVEDLKLIEHFGGNSYFFKVFAVNSFLTEVHFTTKYTQGEEEIRETRRPPINSFADITRLNFQSHFEKFLTLIENYNSVIDNEYDKWNLNSLTTLETIVRMNGNKNVQW